jgi:hypothetical protein
MCMEILAIVCSAAGHKIFIKVLSEKIYNEAAARAALSCGSGCGSHQT